MERPQEGGRKEKKRAEHPPDEAVEVSLIAQKVAKSTLFKKMVGSVVEKIDGTSAMEAIRSKWDALPETAQFAAVHFASLEPTGNFAPFKLLVRAGLLDYKRTPTEKDLASFADDEKKKILLGSHIIPQLKEIGLLIKPIEDAKESVFSSIRQGLKEKRALQEDRARIAEIKKNLN